MNNEYNDRQLNCLYYPFSRLLDGTTLKYLLLVFDSVTFLDEAESPEWRRVLLQRMAQVDGPGFSSYERLADDYDMLADSGVVSIMSPATLRASNSQEVALATIADLSDSQFTSMASKPSAFGLVARPLGQYHRAPAERPTWQVFQGKIASPLLADAEYSGAEEWAKHVLVPGDTTYSWTLSYEAGSAAVTNFYLEAAQELNLTPVTTSQLHHELVLRKLKRILADNGNTPELIDDHRRRRLRSTIGHGETIRLLGELYPAAKLETTSFTKVLEFRAETQQLRQRFIQEVNGVLRVINSNPSSASYDKDVIEAIDKIKFDFQKLERDLGSVRDKILPSLAEAMIGTASGGAISAFASFLGLLPGDIVSASALSVASTFAARAINMWTERCRIHREQRSSVSYLTKISSMLGS